MHLLITQAYVLRDQRQKQLLTPRGCEERMDVIVTLLGGGVPPGEVFRGVAGGLSVVVWRRGWGGGGGGDVMI